VNQQGARLLGAFALVSRQRKSLSAWFAHTTCPEGHCGMPGAAAGNGPYR
jgi:hypothetical protein